MPRLGRHLGRLRPVFRVSARDGIPSFARQRVRFWVADTGGRVLVATAIVADDAKHGAAELPRPAAVVATALVG